MTLLPNSEAINAYLEHLDKHQTPDGQGLEVDYFKKGMGSYLFEECLKEGYLKVMPERSSKVHITAKGTAYLNQVRLIKALEKSDLTNQKIAETNVKLSTRIGVASIFLAIVAIGIALFQALKP